MDAQNAVESSITKQPASPGRADSRSDHSKSATTTTTTTPTKPSVNPRPSSSITAKESKPTVVAPDAREHDPTEGDQNSDAETIVLPGKDGISPSKPRKMIKHEERSEGEIEDVPPPPRKPLKDGRDSVRNAVSSGPSEDATIGSLSGKKKRPLDKEKLHRNKDGSSGLSSAPASPPFHHRTIHDSTHRRRRSGDAHSESGSETSKPQSQRVPPKDQSKFVDTVLPGKRKASKTESDDEGESRKPRQPRLSDNALDTSVSTRERDRKPSATRASDKLPPTRNRSVSPHGRVHRRSLSMQLPQQSSNGLGSKKRRIPAPLTTDYQSDDSSASGSPHPRSSKLKSIATPLTGDLAMSPAKMPLPKKHVDNHGQTLFAKACAKGEYDVAKRRLSERPEDLNFADYAGNTPLQVASLNGHEDIVQLIIDAGCNIHCCNSDKETPLLDAVENGHLAVVKILLKAGVNPRKADAEGHEPLEKVPDDLDNASEIRAVLKEARDERVGELRRTSEDQQPLDSTDVLSSHGPESPRRSPSASAAISLAAQRRGGTVRSTKTSNHLLYMNLDDKTLRQAAARGDYETVSRILQVKERCDDPEALVCAARGGHSLVVELLLALGGANPDPRPLTNVPQEHSTPILAAIGQENIEVIKLLVNASGFDPTRRFKGQTYYEIARRREGPMWKDEEHLLKNAYDDSKKRSKGSSKVKSSPSRRGRDIDTESKRSKRHDSSPDATRTHKRRASSPSRDTEGKRKFDTTKILRSPKEKVRPQHSENNDEQKSPKRGPGRPKREEQLPRMTASDGEASTVMPKAIPAKPKVSESDLAAGSSDGEAVKPRRKLISGKDLKGQREKQRRTSMASNHSITDRIDVKDEDVSEKSRTDQLAEKYHDRTKALKRNESKDRISVGDSWGKRHRSSVTPPHQGVGDNKDDSEAPIKRRKLDADSKEKRHLPASSPDGRRHKRDPSSESARRHRVSESERKDSAKAKKAARDRRESDKSVTSSDKNSITVASDEPDVEMRDAPPSLTDESEARADRERREAEKQQAAATAEAMAVEQAKKEAVRQHLLDVVEAKRREEEAEKKRLEDEERERLEREEAKRKEEEEKARLEEERKRKEEQERRQQEEERIRKEEQERRQREEEDRIRREKEAAEEARRLREEEERMERERKRAERAAREAELLRIRQEEQERMRLSKLPPLLRWLAICPDPKSKKYAELFSYVQGVRYDTINQSAVGRPGGRDQWLLNTHVALLLGEKDLTLSRYTAWERLPVSNAAKTIIWRLEQEAYALTKEKLYHLGQQLPDDFYGGDPRKVGYKRIEHIRGEAAKLFFETDMFFVKESDFLYIVPTVPHLRDIKISICYRELPEKESDLQRWCGPWRYKEDPDLVAKYGRFAPRAKHYVNAEFIYEDMPTPYTPSRTPFPERRVPRRGLVAVSPDESDYARLCVEQNLTHLLTDEQKQSVLTGAHLTPKSMASNEGTDRARDHLSPTAISPLTTKVNGFRSPRGSPDRSPLNRASSDDVDSSRP